MARQRTGQLIWTKGGWTARVTLEIDGEKVRRVVKLGSEDKTVAKRKLKKLLAAQGDTQAAVDEAAELETFSEAAARIFDRREADGVRDVRNERSRFANHIEPYAGALRIDQVEKRELQRVFDEAGEKGLSQATINHVRHVLRIVLADLAIDHDFCSVEVLKRVRLPAGAVDKRERAVLTDDELDHYLAWRHPLEKFQAGVLERQTMASVSRVFGGLRTGDLHSIKWDDFETTNGLFTHGWAPREKTEAPQLLSIPAILRPILRDWWERQGRPTAGLVFPALRGKRAGEGKRGVSHAKAFRRDLRRVFGLEVFDVERETWIPAAVEPTPRQLELLEGSRYRRPVDFHSWRRAYNQALAEAGVNAQQAQALAGHASLDAHAHYLRNTSRMREIPDAALPKLRVSASALPFDSESDRENSLVAARPPRFERGTCGFEVRRSIQLS